MEFRQAIWAAAAQQAGILDRFVTIQHPRDYLAGLSDTDREVLVRTLIAGLRELPQFWTYSEAFRTIIIDLDPPLIRHGVLLTLDIELSGTPAGEALARMRAHFEKACIRQNQQQAYESPQAVEERKRAKREKRAIANANHQSEKRRKDDERLELIAAISRLSPIERLSRFASDQALILDCVPDELIPTQEQDIIDLEKTLAGALLARIGKRKGSWNQLRRILERLVLADFCPPSQESDC